MNDSSPLVPPQAVARLKPLGRVPFGFGPRFLIMLLLGLLWLVPAWWSSRLIVAMFLWDVAAVGVFFFDLLQSPLPSQFEVRRTWAAAPSLATSLDVTLSIRNFGETAIRSFLVDEAPTSFSNFPPSAELIVAGGSSGQANYRILPRERGDVRIGRLFVRYRTRLGFAERWSVADISQTVRVFPDLEQARRHALYLIRTRQVEMQKRRRRQRGLGREFESLRDYRQGDDIRDICWTATARRHDLTTRTFEIERSQVIWIVVDAGRLLRSEVRQEVRQERQQEAAQEESGLRLTKLDYAVNAALSLAQVATQCGDRVGLLAYGRSIQHNLPAGRGPAHLRTIVDCLARVQGEASEADHSRAVRVLLTGQHRRSLVIWITDFAETPAVPEVIEYAMQVARRHLVVFSAIDQPDLTTLAHTIPQTLADMYRHAAALEIVHRRDLLLRGIRQRGVLAFELAPGLLASSLVNEYLFVKERNLI